MAAASNVACRTAAVVDARLSSSFKGLSLSARPSATATLSAPLRASATGRKAGRLEVQARAIEAGVGVMGTKAGMTQIFSEDGMSCDPVTIIGFEDSGNVISMIKTPETDGYSAVQIAYKEGKAKTMTKPEAGHLKKAGIEAPLKKLVEFKLKEIPAGYEVGKQLKPCEMFAEGDVVDVAGISIGKGFAGLRMAGKLGNKRVTSRKLKVIKVYPELNAIAVRGCLPGKPGNTLTITPAKIVGKNN